MCRLIILFLVGMTCAVHAQDEIIIHNGSFEGRPHSGGTAYTGIPGWKDCGAQRGNTRETPPDLHSGKEGENVFFAVDVLPYEGHTYLGMVTRENDTYEAVSQRLPRPLIGKKCYAWRIFLCKAPTYTSGVNGAPDVLRSFTRPIVLRVYGGNTPCDRGELLAESVPITNTEWEEFTFNFEPTKKHNFILIEAFYKTPVLIPYNGNILFDAASDIIPMDCHEEPATVLEEYYSQLEEEVVADVPVKKREEIKRPPAKKEPTPKKQETKKEPVVTQNTPVIKKEEPAIGSTPKKKVLTDLDDVRALRKSQVIRIQQLQFPADSASIKRGSEHVLEEIYEFLEENPRVRIEVRGHTNGMPLHEFCDRLSKERAKTVYDYLVHKGIDPDRMTYKGYGKRKPIASNATDAGKARNQRVEIKILSLTG